MTRYKVEAEVCNAIFAKVESSAATARSTHSSLRGVVEELAAQCSKGEAAQVGEALRGLYNRALTQNMTAAEQRLSRAAAGGKAAVAAIQEGDEIMANRGQAQARDMGELRITDGFER